MIFHVSFLHVYTVHFLLNRTKNFLVLFSVINHQCNVGILHGPLWHDMRTHVALQDIYIVNLVSVYVSTTCIWIANLMSSAVGSYDPAHSIDFLMFQNNYGSQQYGQMACIFVDMI